MSFGQLARYIATRAEPDFGISRNLNVWDPTDRGKVVKQFKDNARPLPKRKNGNCLYHEILSFPVTDSVSLERQKFALREAAERYLADRADKLLAWGQMHEEKGHLHYHFMLSANEIGQSKRHRLTKADFARLQRELEAFILRRFPELGQEPIYGNDRQRRTHSRQRQPDASTRGQMEPRPPSRNAPVPQFTPDLSSERRRNELNRIRRSPLRTRRPERELGR